MRVFGRKKKIALRAVIGGLTDDFFKRGIEGNGVQRHLDVAGVANCARTPPMLLPVEPLPCELSRSMTSTFLQPASVRCQAMLAPTMPPPMMTTSAVCMLLGL